MALVKNIPAEAPIKWRDISPEDAKKERRQQVTLVATAALLLIAAGIGYYLVLKKRPGEAANIKSTIIAPVVASIAAAVSGAAAGFINKEKAQVGSTKKVQKDPAFAEEVKNLLLQGALDVVHKKLYEEKNGGLAVDRHLNVFKDDKTREKAREIVQAWKKEVVKPKDGVVNPQRKSELSRNWAVLQSQVRGEETEV